MPAQRKIPNKGQRVCGRGRAAERTAERAAKQRKAKAEKDKEQASRQQVEDAHAGKIRMSPATTAEAIEAGTRQYLRSEFEKILPELRHLSEEAQAEGLFEELRRWVIDEILSDDPYADANVQL